MLVLLALVASAAEPMSHSSALFLSGFSVEWEKRPHRVRALGFGARADGLEGSAPKGELWSDVRGGTWADGATASDTTNRTLQYAGLASEARTLVSGSAVLELRAERGAPGSQTLEVRVPSDAGAAAVWLRGFRVTSGEDHPAGYTLHELGIELGQATAVDGALQFEIRAQIEAAAVPDRFQRLGTYEARFEIDWLLVPTEPHRTKLHHATTRTKSGVGLAEAEGRTPLERLELDWDVRAADVVAGLSGFRVDVTNEGPVDGRYWRSLDVQLLDAAYDPHAAHWSGEVGLRFENAGPVTRRLGVEVQASVTTLAIEPGESAWSGRWSNTSGGTGAAAKRYP